MSEPRRSTRTRAREEAAAETAPETPKETSVKGAKSTLKRKRASIAIKDSTPSTPANETAPASPKPQTLPLRILDGQPLPTLPEPQPLELPTADWQDIQQSGVLSASLARSRAVWISGVNFRVFHKYFTQPKKPADRTEEDKIKNQRQKDLLKNFPELGKSMDVKGDIEIQAQLVIEPHTFPIRLYAPRETVKHSQKKMTPAPAPTYGSWPNHSQPQHSQPNQYTQYNSHGQPIYQHKQPQPRPPPPKPVQKAPPPTPGPASTPAPDPVIHMLAARAGTDPELKAVMKIVAQGTASKEQLEYFQSHINELTAILAKQKEDASKAQRPSLPPSTPKPNPPPPTPKTQPLPQAPQPVAAAPPPRPVQPAQPAPPHQMPHNAPKPYSPAPPPHGQHVHQAPPVRPTQPPYPNQYNPPHQQYHPPRQMTSYNAPPPSTGYRPLVFSFEEGNKDMLYFPSYSFMEWLPNMSGAKFSFLVTKMKPKTESDPVVKPPSTPAPNATLAPQPIPAPNATPGAPTPTAATPAPNMSTPVPGQMAPNMPASTPATPAPTPFVPPPRIEDFDEKKDVDDIEFYQPVTVLLLTENYDIKQALLRAIRPPDVVERYMDSVFDKCKRAEETYLAFRLPREGDGEVVEKRARSGDGTPVVATPIQDAGVGMAAGLGKTLQGIDKKKTGRPRKSLV